MSADIAIYEYDESMDDRILKSLGVKGGIIGQLTCDVDSDDEVEFITNNTRHIVGATRNPFPRELPELIDGLQTVNSKFLQRIETKIENVAEPPEAYQDTLDWLREREGEQVFIIAL
jgi:hypothetical protein